jgi:hypothetical protein
LPNVCFTADFDLDPEGGTRPSADARCYILMLYSRHPETTNPPKSDLSWMLLRAFNGQSPPQASKNKCHYVRHRTYLLIQIG